MTQKLENVQAVRGFAIVYIVLFHAGNIFAYPWFIHGATALGIFFMLSGFVIGRVHRSDRGFKSAILFCKKRIARVYAPYWVPLIAMLTLIVASGKGSEMHRDALNVLRNALLIQAPSKSIHPYCWYLVYQVYYYATFSVLVIWLRLEIKTYAFLLVTPFALSLIGLCGSPSRDCVPLSGSSVLFAAGLLLGDSFPFTSRRCGMYLVSLAGGLFLGAPFLGIGFGGMTLVTLGFFCTSVYYSGQPYRWLCYFGNASYSTYLTHAIVLSVLKNIITERNELMFVVFVAASLVLGAVYYECVEKTLIQFALRLLVAGEPRGEARVVRGHRLLIR